MKLRCILASRPSIVALAASIISASNVMATTYYVKPGGGTTGGTSWATAFGSPQRALEVATENDEIWVAAGTYVPTNAETPDPRSRTFRLKRGVKLYGGFIGTEPELNGLELRNPAIHLTTLSGDINGDDGANFANRGDNAYHVIYAKWFENFDPNCVPNCPVIKIQDTTQLDGFVIRGGAATGTGGEGLNEGASDAFGGGALVIASAPVFQNCLFTDNLATNGGGGHTSGLAGAAIPGGADPANPKFISCSFTRNRANISGGGHSNSHDTTNFLNCSFSNNDAVEDGGALFNFAGGLLRVKRINVLNCSFSVNYAPVGSAISNGGKAYVHNSIIWGNLPSTEPQIHTVTGEPIFTDINYSDCLGCPLLGIGNRDDDPQFVNPSIDNLRLDIDSDCRNRGHVSDVLDDDPDPFPPDVYDVNNDEDTQEEAPDRDRLTRVIPDNAIDMGAYEVDSPTSCCGDLNSDGIVNVTDLLIVVTTWTQAGPADIAPACGGDGIVNVSDLLKVVDLWGACPGVEPPPGGIAGIPQSYYDCGDLCAGLSGQSWSECMAGCFEILCKQGQTEFCLD